jgi:hypothetical protein
MSGLINWRQGFKEPDALLCGTILLLLDESYEVSSYCERDPAVNGRLRGSLGAGRDEDRGVEQRKVVECARRREKGSGRGDEKGCGFERCSRVRVELAPGTLALVQHGLIPGEVQEWD